MAGSDMGHSAAQLEDRLAAFANPDRATKERAYLKSTLRHLGVSVPVIRKQTLQVLNEHPELSRADILSLVVELWTVPLHETRMAAVEVLRARSHLLQIDDVPLLERLLREAKTWALVDTLATHIVGDLRERYPDAMETTLEAWSQDPDMWLRRASMLAYLVTLRSGSGDFAAFARKADRMLDEPEFFIRKAIGWVLRETARRQPEVVVAWLEPRLNRASPLTVREAVKHLPEADRVRLLATKRL